MARRAWVRRRAATTSEDVSARTAFGSDEEEEEGFSGPRRRIGWRRVGLVLVGSELLLEVEVLVSLSWSVETD